MNETLYPQVNKVLRALQDGAARILGAQYVGLYLYGSLAGGDFTPERSDIDFVVVTADLLSQATIAELETFHLELAQSGLPWADKLEGLYLPLALLPRHDRQGPPLPTVNEGRFYLAGQGDDWIIQRHLLRTCETIVDGPSISALIEPVTPDQLRQAARDVMRDWWAPMADDPAWIADAPYQSFAVLSLCRVLHTLDTGESGSKTAAAEWALASLDESWHDLISEALAWRYGRPFSRKEEVLAFVRYVAAEAGV